MQLRNSICFLFLMLTGLQASAVILFQPPNDVAAARLYSASSKMPGLLIGGPDDWDSRPALMEWQVQRAHAWASEKKPHRRSALTPVYLTQEPLPDRQVVLQRNMSRAHAFGQNVYK